MAIRKNQRLKFGVNLSYINNDTKSKERIQITDTYAKILQVSKDMVHVFFERSKISGIMSKQTLQQNTDLILFIDAGNSN